MHRAQGMKPIGERISQRCTKYERRYQGEHLALATRVTIDELLRSRHILLATRKLV